MEPLPASAWYAQHFWEHYAFSRRQGFLRTMAYPMLKEVTHSGGPPDGAGGRTLVAPDGWSPNTAREKGVSYDQEIIWDLFTNYIDASERYE